MEDTPFSWGETTRWLCRPCFYFPSVHQVLTAWWIQSIPVWVHGCLTQLQPWTA